MASESAVGGWTPGGTSLHPLPNTTPSPPPKETAPPYYVPDAADDPTSNRYPRTSMDVDDSSGCGDCVRATAEWVDDKICCGCTPTQRTNECCSYVCVGCVGGCLAACSKAC